jgi:hypothetical protein
MIRFGWLACGLSLGVATGGTPAFADSVTDGLRVSVRVVRSCSVQTIGTVATVACGGKVPGAQGTARTPAAVVRTVSPSSGPGTTTVNF